jgi:hypothetical protein
MAEGLRTSLQEKPDVYSSMQFHLLFDTVKTVGLHRKLLKKYPPCFYFEMDNKMKYCILFQAEIRMSHLDRPYFVTMGTYQMAILLIFNEHQQLTLNEIEEGTKLNMKELEKQILSLIESKFLLNNKVR